MGAIYVFYYRAFYEKIPYFFGRFFCILWYFFAAKIVAVGKIRKMTKFTLFYKDFSRHSVK